MSDEVEQRGLPYSADYAKTNRSSCKDKDCDEKSIEVNDLRMSARTKSAFHEGLQDNWFHFDCFWKRARKGINEAAIRHFEHLRWEDQERIRARIKRKDDYTSDDIKAEKNAKAEYAKTGKSTCGDCNTRLAIDELRIEFHSKFHHPKCLADLHIYKKTADQIDGFDDLDDQDKDLLRELFVGKTADDLKKEQAGKDDEMTFEELKEASNDGMDEEGMKKLKAIEERKEALKKQTDLIWEAREDIDEALKDKKTKTAKVKKEFVETLIKKNGGNVYKKSTLDDGIQYLADIMVFGGFEKCPTCSIANFYYSPDRRVYQCAGAGDDGRCSYSSREIKRKPFNANGNDALKKYDGKQLLPEGRVYSKSVEEHAEEDRLVITAPQPAKKIDPTRKRKKAEAKGIMKKNGFTIDPYFSLAEDFHVYVDEDGIPYQFLSHKVDPKTNDIKFYKLQLLEEDGDGSEVYLFRRYGVVLTDATKDQKDDQQNLKAGIREFSRLFLEKTGHTWADFTSKKDVKPKDGKYQVVEWDVDMAGSYGRTTAESQADENVVDAKKAKKTKTEVKKEEEDESD